MMDAALALYLMRNLCIVQEYVGMSRVCFITPEMIISRGQQVRVLMLIFEDLCEQFNAATEQLRALERRRDELAPFDFEAARARIDTGRRLFPNNLVDDMIDDERYAKERRESARAAAELAARRESDRRARRVRRGLGPDDASQDDPDDEVEIVETSSNDRGGGGAKADEQAVMSRWQRRPGGGKDGAGADEVPDEVLHALAAMELEDTDGAANEAAEYMDVDEEAAVDAIQYGAAGVPIAERRRQEHLSSLQGMISQSSRRNAQNEYDLMMDVDDEDGDGGG